MPASHTHTHTHAHVFQMKGSGGSPKTTGSDVFRCSFPKFHTGLTVVPLDWLQKAFVIPRLKPIDHPDALELCVLAARGSWTPLSWAQNVLRDFPVLSEATHPSAGVTYTSLGKKSGPWKSVRPSRVRIQCADGSRVSIGQAGFEESGQAQLSSAQLSPPARGGCNSWRS